MQIFYKQKSGYIGTVVKKIKKPYLGSTIGIPHNINLGMSVDSIWIEIKLSEKLRKLKKDYSNRELSNDDLKGKMWVMANNTFKTKVIDKSLLVRANDICTVELCLISN